MTDDLIRLNKRMAQLGLCSRREADRFIAAGQVLVDGERVSELGLKVRSGQQITLSEAAAEVQQAKVTVLLNKPPGWVSGQPEEGYRAAAELVRLPNLDPRAPWTPWGRGRPPRDWWRGLAPAGRLDIDSTGLLVLTADGVVARTLISPERKVDKEYIVGVRGELTPERLRKLRHGLSLDGRQLMRARVDRLGRDQLRFVLREGRKRQIRRMCELVGLEVRTLLRVRIGRIHLGELPRGCFRFLRPDERF